MFDVRWHLACTLLGWCVAFSAQAGTDGFTAPYNAGSQRTDLTASAGAFTVQNGVQIFGRGGALTAPARKVSRPGFQVPTAPIYTDFLTVGDVISYYDYSGSNCDDLDSTPATYDFADTGTPAYPTDDTVPGAISTKRVLDTDAASGCTDAVDDDTLELATFSLAALVKVGDHQANGFIYADTTLFTDGFYAQVNGTLGVGNNVMAPITGAYHTGYDSTNTGWVAAVFSYAVSDGQFRVWINGINRCDLLACSGVSIDQATNVGAAYMGSINGNNDQQMAYTIYANTRWAAQKVCELQSFGPRGTGNIRGFQAPTEPTWRYTGSGC